MGFLNQNGTTANQLAGQSLNWGNLGAGADAIGPAVSGFGGWQQANYQAGIARGNAATQRENANQDLKSGQYAESLTKLNAGKTASTQRAGMAANGVDVNIGSPAAVQSDTEQMGLMDAAMIHFNAARQSFAAQMEANTLETQAKLDKKVGTNALLSGITKGSNSYITAASGLNSKWRQYAPLGVRAGG